MHTICYVSYGYKSWTLTEPYVAPKSMNFRAKDRKPSPSMRLNDRISIAQHKTTLFVNSLFIAF